MGNPVTCSRRRSYPWPLKHPKAGPSSSSSSRTAFPSFSQPQPVRSVATEVSPVCPVLSCPLLLTPVLSPSNPVFLIYNPSFRSSRLHLPSQFSPVCVLGLFISFPCLSFCYQSFFACFCPVLLRFNIFLACVCHLYLIIFSLSLHSYSFVFGSLPRLFIVFR